MFTQTNRIVRTIRNTKLTLAAAVAAVGLGTATHAYGAVSDVTSITTQLTTGSSSVVTGLTGGGTTSDYLASDSTLR